MALLIGVDQSTSATKALLFDEAGSVLAQVALPHTQIYPQPGWVEHDADEIYQNTVAAIRSLALEAPEALSAIGLSITNQRETVVVWDAESGKPLHNAIVWQDRRGDPFCRELMQGTDGERNQKLVRELTGLRIDTYFPASKLRWLQDNFPDIKQKLADGTALFGTIDCWLIYRLTGGAVYATDATNASRTLLYDIDALAWSSELTDLFGLTIARLPQVREPASRFGETTVEGLLPAPIPICGVMGDSQGALLAQRCFAPGSAKVTFGSGSSLLMTLGNNSIRGNSSVTALAWQHNSSPTYALEGITNFTGATIAWLRDQLGLISSVEETEALATSVSDNGGVYLVPAFVGLSAPHWRADARALITGLTPASTRAHVVRAALESTAFVVADALKAMESDAGFTIFEIHADGGAVRNRFLMQRVADLTERPVVISPIPEASALGAALAGLVGLGVCTWEELQTPLPTSTCFTPSLSANELASLRQGWNHALRQTFA
jgi:glycerol kinase